MPTKEDRDTSLTETELRIALDRLVEDPDKLVMEVMALVRGRREEARKLRGKEQRERVKDLLRQAKEAGFKPVSPEARR